MAVVLTRPQAEAERWAARLRERGLEPLLLPLLQIGPPPDPQALRAACTRAGDCAAVMFVSANAVQAFFAAAPGVQLARAWAPGPATRDALLAAGVPAERIDAPAAESAQFDSESLWQQVQGQLRAGDRLLLVRGGDGAGREQGRDWLLQQLAARGVQVETVLAYTRQPPAWTQAQQAAARRAAADGSTWIFSSSEAATHLATLLPAQDWSRARAVATHPRIAAAVRALGFGAVRAARPGLEDVLASIESVA
ncbi:uroporphyrinogen-III synthase [Ramlibacter ginsenosidimutans]|uniref:Uroporphyrinogen-III synthase n=1 Tax=Ramlibacter ginsenosidimutans TaxID=502333 RepID=A0A934TTX9_9BURK|nr:uroporphyrinogen-III synthase [Ramlibacter ginsenosidimutans]MBK6006946.1 uroporphyrinogen-III synthase [Ramlibacter ginsenosidimutans]